MKIAAAIISMLFTLVQGVIWFFIALIALNGFSEREANPALLTLGGIVFVAVIAAGFVGGGIATWLLSRKPGLKGWVVVIAVGLTSMLVAVMLFVGLLMIIGIASAMHGGSFYSHQPTRSQ